MWYAVARHRCRQKCKMKMRGTIEKCTLDHDPPSNNEEIYENLMAISSIYSNAILFAKNSLSHPFCLCLRFHYPDLFLIPLLTFHKRRTACPPERGDCSSEIHA